MVRVCVISVALSVFSLGEAFVASPSSPSFVGHVKSWELYAGMAQPEIKIGQKTALVTETKQKVVIQKRNKVDDPVSRREEDFEEAPLYKVMLLGDDAYDGAHVMERMCAIMEDMDEDQAANIFQQAQQEGKAMCGKYPMEHAEMYKEQLIRSDPMIFSDMEEENE